MKDFFQNYKKKKIASQSLIIGSSFLFALSINFFLFQNSSGKMLSANIMNSVNVSEKKSVSAQELHVTASGNSISLSNTEKFNEIQELNISLAYNPQELEILDFQTLSGALITGISNDPGFYSFLIQFSVPKNIDIGSQLLTFRATKTKNNSPSIINFVGINYTNAQKNTTQLSLESFAY